MTSHQGVCAISAKVWQKHTRLQLGRGKEIRDKEDGAGTVAGTVSVGDEAKGPRGDRTRPGRQTARITGQRRSKKSPRRAMGRRGHNSGHPAKENRFGTGRTQNKDSRCGYSH